MKTLTIIILAWWFVAYDYNRNIRIIGPFASVEQCNWGRIAVKFDDLVRTSPCWEAK